MGKYQDFAVDYGGDFFPAVSGRISVENHWNSYFCLNFYEELFESRILSCRSLKRRRVYKE